MDTASDLSIRKCFVFVVGYCFDCNVYVFKAAFRLMIAKNNRQVPDRKLLQTYEHFN